MAATHLENVNAYVKSGRVDTDYQELVNAIRAGSWDYPEETLEREVRVVRALAKGSSWQNIIMYVCCYGGGGLMVVSQFYGIVFAGREPEIVFLFLGGLCLSTPFVVKRIANATAAKFLNHVRKLEGGGIKVPEKSRANG